MKEIKTGVKFVVYGIIDPRDRLFFYVGYTGCLAHRKMGHKVDSRCRSSIRIAELKEQDLQPIFAVLEECRDEHHALRAEVFWVELFKSRGATLMNHPTFINTECSPKTRNADNPYWVPTPPLHRAEKEKEETEERRRQDYIREGSPQRRGQPWKTHEDIQLTKMFRERVDVKVMAQTFQRTQTGIASRLVKLGLVENTYDPRIPRQIPTGEGVESPSP
jgi:hypothetical protein